MDLSQFRLKTVSSTESPANGFQATPSLARTGGVFGRASLSINAQGDAVELSLKGGKVSDGKAAEQTDSSNKPESESGIHSLLKEIQTRSARIQQLQEARENIATGTERYDQYSSEIASEQQALQQSLSSPQVGKIFDIIKQVQGSAQGGASPAQLASALQSNGALLGDDFIARVGNGEFSQISLFGGYLSTLQSAITEGNFDRPGIFDLIDTAVSGAIKSLEGPALSATAAQSANAATQSLIAPLPEIEQVSFGNAQGLAVGIRGYIGTNAVQAAMAHIDYDPRDALVLLAPPKEETDSEKIEREEKKEDQSDARLAAGLRD